MPDVQCGHNRHRSDRRRRPARPPGRGDRGQFRDRGGDGPRARRGGRRRHPRRAGHRSGHPRRGAPGEGTAVRIGAVDGRAARPGRPVDDHRVRGGLAGPAAHPGEQRRGDGHASAHPHPRGPGMAVRRQPPGPLRPRHRPPPRARGGGRRAGRVGQLHRPPLLPRRLRRPGLPLPPLRPVDLVRAVEDGQRPVRRGCRRALGRRRDHGQRADAGQRR